MASPLLLRGRQAVLLGLVTACSGTCLRYFDQPALCVVPPVSARRLTNGLQTLIAKGRKNHKRSALKGNYAPIEDEVRHVGRAGRVPWQRYADARCAQSSLAVVGGRPQAPQGLRRDLARR